MAKILSVSEPGEDTLIYPWSDSCSPSLFAFDADDIAVLQSGDILWRGDTNFSLEEEDAVMAGSLHNGQGKHGTRSF